MVIAYFDKKKPKPFFKTIIFWFLFFLALAIFFFTFGINFILNTSAIISNFFKKTDKTSNLKPTPTLGLIELDYIPTATNSSSFYISGSTLNIDKLEFYLNKNKVKEISLTTDTFTEETTGLTPGKNTFYIVGKDKNNHIIKKTEEYIIFYKADKPRLKIIQPENGVTVNQSEIIIKGETDKETFIKINQSPVVVDALGNFSFLVKLQEGENIIQITAEDEAGNIEEKILTVIYQKED